MHQFAAIDQQILMSKFMNTYVGKHAPSHSVPNTIFSDSYENLLDDMPIEQKTTLEIQVQIADFDVSFALPFYVQSCSSMYYLHFNMMMQNFIIANVINYVNNAM